MGAKQPDNGLLTSVDYDNLSGTLLGSKNCLVCDGGASEICVLSAERS